MLAILTPSAIVFLGDLIDEASEATSEEQARLSSSLPLDPAIIILSFLQLCSSLPQNLPTGKRG